LRLAKLELSRGDRSAAIKDFTTLAQHAPAGLTRTEALVSTADAQLADGDTASACQNISPELSSMAAPDSGLAHRLTAISSVCATRVAPLNAGTPADSTTAHARDSIPTRAGKRG